MTSASSGAWGINGPCSSDWFLSEVLNAESSSFLDWYDVSIYYTNPSEIILFSCWGKFKDSRSGVLVRPTVYVGSFKAVKIVFRRTELSWHWSQNRCIFPKRGDFPFNSSVISSAETSVPGSRHAPNCLLNISVQCLALGHVRLSVTPRTVAHQRPRDSPGKNISGGCHALLQGIFPTQGSNPGLPHCRQILYHLSHQGSSWILEWAAYSSQGIFPIKKSNQGLLHRRQILYQQSLQGSSTYCL